FVAILYGREDQENAEAHLRLRTQSSKRRHPSPPEAQQAGFFGSRLSSPGPWRQGDAGADRRESTARSPSALARNRRRSIGGTAACVECPGLSHNGRWW